VHLQDTAPVSSRNKTHTYPTPCGEAYGGPLDKIPIHASLPRAPLVGAAPHPVPYWCSLSTWKWNTRHLQRSVSTVRKSFGHIFYMLGRSARESPLRLPGHGDEVTASPHLRIPARTGGWPSSKSFPGRTGGPIRFFENLLPKLLDTPIKTCLLGVNLCYGLDNSQKDFAFARENNRSLFCSYSSLGVSEYERTRCDQGGVG